MELLYRAYDGEIFSSKEECESYEAKLEAKNFDKDLERIIYLTSENGVATFIPIKKLEYFNYYDICYVPDEAAFRAIKTLSDFRYSNIQVGYNYRAFNEYSDEWVQNRVEELIERQDELNKEIEIFEEGVMLIENEITKRKKERKFLRRINK